MLEADTDVATIWVDEGGHILTDVTPPRAKEQGLPVAARLPVVGQGVERDAISFDASPGRRSANTEERT